MLTRRIGLFLQNLENDYQQLLRDDCRTTGARHGFHVDVFSADGNPNKQVQQIHNALRLPLAARLQAVLVSPVRESNLMSNVTEALRSNIGWIMLSRFSDYLASARSEFASVPLFCVMPDHEEIGRIQGRQFKALLPAGGELVYIRGPLGTYSAERRLTGMQKELADTAIHPLIFNSDWTLDGGARAITDWVSVFGAHELPACVVGAQNDSMALGARQALLGAAGKKKEPIGAKFAFTGCDGSSGFGQRLVRDGQLAATILVPSVSGRAVIELASMLDGKSIPPLSIIVDVSSYPLEHLLGKRRPK